MSRSSQVENALDLCQSLRPKVGRLAARHADPLDQVQCLATQRLGRQQLGQAGQRLALVAAEPVP
jgi:hypothetical protein